MPSKLVTPFVPGAVIGPYCIANVPGGGAVGEAVDSNLRRVALKRLPDGLADDWEKLGEFRALIQSISELRQPGIVGVHGVEVHDGAAYLVMDYSGRGSVAAQVATVGRWPWMQATRRLIEVARTMEAVHNKGLVHGDIRPSNLLLNAEGGLLLADFGGGIVGTRSGDYSAPELFSGSPPHPAADIYSLGATYFALLTGHAPFADATDEAALADA